MAVVPTLPKCPSSQPPSLTFFSSTPSFRISLVKLKPPPPPSFFCCATQSELAVVNGRAEGRISERNEIRLGLPSKGRMAADTLDLLKDCQLSVKQVNPRQYVAEIPQLSNLEVWFQRPKDIVRKLLSGDLDLGIMGLDTVSEYGQGNEDLIIVHDALDYGDCRLSLAIPKYGIFENINSLKELSQMPQWTEEKPLRVATGFTYLGPKFMKENGLKYVTFSTADGALEAAPAMGIADAILDLVSSGTTLRENNLKEIEGGVVLESQAVLVASRRSLIQRKGVLDTTHEIIERLEAHLRAVGQFTVVANMRGSSAEEVAERVLSQMSLSGLQGPTVSPVFCRRDGKVSADYYAIVICVPKKALYKSVQQLRAIGGSGVLISPLTYIFDEETPRWRELLSKLGLQTVVDVQLVVRTRQGDKTIRYHVAEIREAAYDLEDVVATFALKIASRSDRGRKYILQRFPWILIDLHKVGKEVEKICAKISKSRSSFQLNGVLGQSRDKEGASSSNKRHQVDLRRAFSHNIDSDFVGSDKNIKELVSHLTREGSLHKVVSICGMGGLGKTTLARKIYFHSDVRLHFDCFAWASVSQNYQARDIWEGILIKLISPTAEKRREIKDMRDDEISQALNETLKQEKCLVVLDDIWTAEAWDCLKSAFPNVRSESKVLFTTRNRDLASHADRESILHEPKCLEGNESWELLKKKTFFGTNVTDLEDDKRKQKLAQEMLDHCGGLPLAITVLGGLLSNKQGNEWETLHRNIKILLRRGKISEQEDSNLGVSWVLGLSYDELPYHLKPCFLYLASFPEYFEVRAKELCRLWMAEGFVSNEDVAYECLSELVERCLVQVAKWGLTGRIKTCRLHDLMRDLCLSKAQEENFLQAVDLHNQQEAINSSSVGMTTNLLPTNKVRRLAIYLDDVSVDGLLSLLRNKDACLRSLTCFRPVSEDYYRSFRQAMKPLHRSCHLLRVLKFEDLKIGKLPKEIGDLIHLRLFSLRGSYVEELPSSIRNLRCLQTLDLQLRQEFEMPSAICELEQMRHLYLPGFWRKTFPFDGLVNLQTLVNAFAKDHFLDGLEKLASLTKLKVNLARDVRGATIRLNSLRSLAIVDPDHSTSPTTEFTEFVKSVIVNCPQVYKLHLEVCLVMLPEEKEFPPNLTKLTLVNTRLEDDPTATLEKLPNLRILVFQNDSFIGTEMVFRRKGFRKLESLSIRYLVHLEEWKVEKEALPSLCRLHIEHCFQLRRIPVGVRFLITLKEIVIQSMPLRFKRRLTQGDFYKVKHVPSLVFLDDNVRVAPPPPQDFFGPPNMGMNYYTPI